MPYIPKHDRDILYPVVTQVLPKTVGGLNYCITKILQEYVEHKGLSYQTLNDVLGVLACVSQEYYRRVGVPYEESKRISNGDIFK